MGSGVDSRRTVSEGHSSGGRSASSPRIRNKRSRSAADNWAVAIRAAVSTVTRASCWRSMLILPLLRLQAAVGSLDRLAQEDGVAQPPGDLGLGAPIVVRHS